MKILYFPRFPDNIVVLKNRQQGQMAQIFCVEKFFWHEAVLKVEGRCFKEVKPTFKTPYVSSDIGNYFCAGGLETEVMIVDFTDILGKCFAFPLIMPSKCNIDPEVEEQEWIVQIISHSNMY